MQMAASRPLLIRLSSKHTGNGNPQSFNILTCVSDQVSQAAAYMILFLAVASGDAKVYSLMFDVCGCCRFSGYQLPVTRYKAQGTRHKVQGTRSKLQGTRYKVQGAGTWNFSRLPVHDH